LVSGGSHLSSLAREGVELTRVAKIRIKTATALVLNMLQLHVSVAAYNLGKRFTQRDLAILKVGNQYFSFTLKKGLIGMICSLTRSMQ
jgi:hypothetical protein